MKYILLLIFLLHNLVIAKELLTESKLKEFISSENPHIYIYKGDIEIKKAKEKYNLGDLDFKISPTYEKKEYPLSTSRYYSLFLKKKFIQGIDTLIGYRKAIGTQEYNNIKTSKEGEILLGIKIPLFETLFSINKTKLNILLSKLDTQIAKQKYQNSLRKFRFKIYSSYYKLLYYKKALELEKTLMEKALKRKKFIEEKIKLGLLPKVYIYEAEQQIINRKKRLLKAKQEYENGLNILLSYLNIEKELFMKKYQLPDIENLYLKYSQKNLDERKALDLAIKNRPELKSLKLEEIKIKNEKRFYSIYKYPKTEIALYGVNDFKYKEGFKIIINMEYPINRRKYLGKISELTNKQSIILAKKRKFLLELQRDLFNTINKLKTLKTQIQNSEKEIKLVEKLEEIEKEKFKHGASTLFYINQREIYTQKTKLKNLKYKLEYLINYKKYLNILNLDWKTW